MESLEVFYSDPRRRESREVQFGSGWLSSEHDGMQFVVFWIADTRELCALGVPNRSVRSDGFFSRFVLELPPHVRPNKIRDEEATVMVLGRTDEDKLEESLAGWEDHRGAGGGIEWVSSKIADSLRSD